MRIYLYSALRNTTFVNMQGTKKLKVPKVN